MYNTYMSFLKIRFQFYSNDPRYFQLRVLLRNSSSPYRRGNVLSI